MRLFQYSLVLGLLAFVLVPACKCSCNVGGGIDSKKVEALIMSSFKGQGVVSAKCPESVSNEKDSTFECTGKNAAGGDFKFGVKVLDDQNNVEVVVTAAP